MTIQKRTQYRILGLVSFSLIILAAAYGFTGANTIQNAGVLGVGFGIKSAYAVSKISYALDVENPSTFTAVVFEIDQESDLVFAGVSATEKGQVVWADDCERSATIWTCTFDESIDVLAADWLHVSPFQ